MKFLCDKSTILKEISIAQEIISVKNVLSILSNVLIEANNNSLTIRATDLKVDFETTIPVEVITPGSTTVFCDKLLGIIRSLPENEIEFELKEESFLFITPLNSKINFKLKCISADKFPEIQSVENDKYFIFPQKEFSEMVSQTIFSISDDETRYFMNGVFLEKKENNLIMVATDGRRLSIINKLLENEIYDFKGIIIPSKILLIFKKLSSLEGNLEIALTEKTLFLKFDNLKISSNLIEGQFPNYNRVIPEKQDFDIVLNKSDFIQALKRVSLLAEHKSKRIYLTISNSVVTLSSEESDIGLAKEEISCNFEGETTSMALNFIYMQEPLKVIDTDEIQINFSESNKAITVNSFPKKDYFHIIMPMQMD